MVVGDLCMVVWCVVRELAVYGGGVYGRGVVGDLCVVVWCVVGELVYGGVVCDGGACLWWCGVYWCIIMVYDGVRWPSVCFCGA